MAATGTGLARGAIGLREVLFQSVTSMAPAGAVALSIAAGATYAGGALPLAVLLALIACLLVATSIGQLAKHLPSAGSIYTYPAEAIHPALGFGSACCPPRWPRSTPGGALRTWAWSSSWC